MGEDRPILRIWLLGDVMLSTGAQPVPLVAFPKSAPLLAYLLMHRKRALPRDHVASLLWPENLASDARANLRRHLHRTIGALPPAPAATPWILTTTKTLAWNDAAPFWLDVDAFVDACARPESADSAWTFYGGDFLSSYDEPWILNQRNRLRALAFANRTSEIARARARRDYGAALEHVRAARLLEPMDESIVRLAMSVRFEAGDRAGAIAEYEQFADRVFGEFGMQPMPETVATLDRIVENRTALDAAKPGTRAREQAATDLPFVGRAREMAALESAWQRVGSASGCVVFVTGEPGIGKSRLMTEFSARVERAEGSTFSGTTAPQETQPYQGFAEALRSGLDVLLHTGLEPLWLGALAPLLPNVLARRPDVVRPPLLEEKAERSRLFEAIARALEACARSRPRLVVIDDVHWASGSTLDLLDYLARRLDTSRVMLAVTARDTIERDHPLHAIRRGLVRAELAIEVPLGRLAFDDVAEICAKSRSNRTPIDARALYARTDGNPLFVRLAGVETGANDLAAAIGDTFERLTDGGRSLVEFASVCGQGFDIDVVTDVCGWETAHVLDFLDELIDRRIVREAAHSHRTDYVFAHPLLWQRAYETMPEARRRRAHRRTARALGEFARDRPESAGEIARHHAAAGEAARAVPYYLRACEYAASIGANSDAIASAAAAVELAVDARDRLSAHALLEDLHGRVGAHEARRHDLAVLEDLCARGGDIDIACEVARRRARFADAVADCVERDRAIDDLTVRAKRSGKPRWAAILALTKARAALSSGDAVDAAILARVAVENFAYEDDAEGRLDALIVAIESYSSVSDWDSVRRSLREAREIAAAYIAPTALARVLRAASFSAFSARDFVEAEHLSLEGLALAERLGDIASQAELSARLGSIGIRRFDIVAALAHFARAIAAYETIGNARMAAGVLMNSAMADFALGNVDEALAKTDRAARRFEAIADRRGLALCASNSSYYLAVLGRFSDAVVRAYDAFAHAEGGGPQLRAHVYAALGHAQYRAGLFANALETLIVGTQLRRESNNGIDLAEDLKDLCLTYLKLGRHAEALATAEELTTKLDDLVSDSIIAQDLFWAVAQVFDVCADPRAAETLARAQALVRDRLTRLPDDATRTRFLGVTPNQAIVDGFRTAGSLSSRGGTLD